MKRKILLLFLIIIMLSGCGNGEANEEESKKLASLAFKETFEAVNGTYDSEGNKYVELSIPEDNPFVTIDVEEALALCDSKKNFFLYVDNPTNEWGRTGLEELIEAAKNYNIDTIYYLNLKDDRDLITYDKGTTAIPVNGTLNYQYLIEKLSPALQDYVIVTDENTFYDTEEGRIYDNYLFYVKDGEGVEGMETYMPFITFYTDNITNDMRSYLINKIGVFINKYLNPTTTTIEEGE